MNHNEDAVAQQPEGTVETEAHQNHAFGNGTVQRDHAVPSGTSGTVHNNSGDAIDEKDQKLETSHLENGAGDLSPEHRDYLMKRHGTLDLAPLPTMDPADPLNWPAWKVCTISHP